MRLSRSKVVETVSIELAGDHVAVERALRLALKELDHLVRHVLVELDEDSMNLAVRVHDDALREPLVVDATDALEDMAERTVTEVVQQGRDEADRLALFIDPAGRSPCAIGQDLPCRLHDAEAVAVARMVRPGIRKRAIPSCRMRRRR
jgi:hypothetical protein